MFDEGRRVVVSTQKKPKFIALWLCAACVAFFGLQQVFGTELFLLIRAQMWAEPWRIITSIFAHSGAAHLLSNLFALGLFGLILEGRIGSKKVFWLFMISGVVINLVTPYPRSLGASGAIFAIIGALTMLRPKMIVWVSGMPVPMIIAGFIWLFQDVVGVFVPSNVGNLAHLGGLAIGVMMGLVWRKEFGGPLFKMKQRDPDLDRQLDQWHDAYMKK
jgi:membrane associated rhomboid family serine protease